MLESPAHHSDTRRANLCCIEFRWSRRLVLSALLVVEALSAQGQGTPATPKGAFPTPLPRHFLTNIVQFQTLTARDYLDECVFRLQGTLTLVDTNRDLLVLQDSTGAIALHAPLQNSSLKGGQRVSVVGTNCHPYIAGLPGYPYHPSGRDIRTSFDAPTNWSEYYATRMRGYLRPPATGEYTFWIASDNSSELWLSPDEIPSDARKIASVPRFGYVNPHEWRHYPSQRSEPIFLKAGSAYYIEALQEQTTENDNLAVAWQGPGMDQSVIAGTYLTPWNNAGSYPPLSGTNGILREYWTNFSAGDLTILSGPTPFESQLAVEDLRVDVLGSGKMPEPRRIGLGQALPVADNFCWVETEGLAKFVGVDGNSVSIDLSDGASVIPVRALHCTPDLSGRMRDSLVRVQGVCEAGYDQSGTLVPCSIWAPEPDSISLIERARTNASTAAPIELPTRPATNGKGAVIGFYGTRGVVTFNDSVFGRDYLYVQEDVGSTLVNLEGLKFEKRLRVGQSVELGGAFERGKYIPVFQPLVLIEHGLTPLPQPISPASFSQAPENIAGQWTELDGVVHSVNSNGTVSLMGKAGLACLWIGQTASNQLSSYVDARVRVRGVLSLTILDSPLLLIPSRDFVEVEEPAPPDPFKIPPRIIAVVIPDDTIPADLHRSRVRGVVTYVDSGLIYVQDHSGGIQVQTSGRQPVNLGQFVQVTGFPSARGTGRFLTDALLRPTDGPPPPIAPRHLDITEPLSFEQSDTLSQTTGNLLGIKEVASGQILELQEQRRIFTAILAASLGRLPVIAPDSRLQVTGVCDDGTGMTPVPGAGSLQSSPAGSLRIWLRSPADVVVLSGPPWLTLQRTAWLIGTLVIVLAVTLLWVHLLRTRLERHQASRLAFSRQVLQGQENERQRVAVNLHDSLGQNLLVIKNQIRLAMQPAPEESQRQGRLGKISEITSQAIEELRQITHNLRPYQLDRLGLTQAIRAVVNQALENNSIVVASHLDNIDSVFDKESEIHLYRIVQEALNNILKHSGATEATVVVKNQTGVVSLSIRDNGRGFEPGAAGLAAAQDIGYGLNGMTERVHILGGNLKIDSQPGHGASIMIEIPKKDLKP